MSNTCDDLRLLFHNKPTIANLLAYERCEKDKQPTLVREVHNKSICRNRSRPRRQYERGF